MTTISKTRKWSGKKIAMPGIYAGMPMADYHRGDICIEPSISSSGLRTLFNQSPKHFWATSPLNPNRIEDGETRALVLGRAAHHLLFGEAGFHKQFAVRPEVLGGEKWQSKGNRNACKLWLQERSAKGLTVLTLAEIERITGMAASLSEEPLVRAGILNGEIERSWFIKDTATGIWLKSRPDASPNDGLDFCDLKTTRSVQWRDLQRTVADYAYHMQAGLLSIICKELMGVPMSSFSLCFVESSPPYCARIVTLKDNDIERGERQNMAALKTFAECLKSGKWLGPGGGKEDAVYLELPEWEQKSIDSKLELNTQ